MLNITETERRSLLRYFPSAQFSQHYIRIPNFRLPSDEFIPRAVDLLISIRIGAEPQVYVPRELFCLRGGNHHLDFDTEAEMAQKGWKKLCIKKTWTPQHGLMSVLNMVQDFFRELGNEV